SELLCACAGRAPTTSNARPSSRSAIQPRRALTLVVVPLVLNRIPLADRSHRQGPKQPEFRTGVAAVPLSWSAGGSLDRLLCLPSFRGVGPWRVQGVLIAQ